VAFGTLIAVGTPLVILTSTVIATGNYKFVAVLNCATALIQICLILLFGLLGSISLQVVVGIAALASLLVTTVVTVFFVRRARHVSTSSIGMREVISFGLHLQWGVLIKQISSRCELLFVVGILTPAQTGLFSLALSVRDAALAPQGIYTAPLQNLIIDRNRPDGLANDRSAIPVSILLQLIFATAMTVGAALALPFIIPLLFGQEFKAAVGPAIVLVASTIFIGATGICFIAFNAKGRPQFTSLLQAAIGIPTPFVIYFMAQAFGIYGASLAALLMAAMGLILSFGVIARMQRYTTAELRTSLHRTPHVLFAILKNISMQLNPKRLFSRERQ
jgi:O-antigen/teichoic acid export membrane protein